MPSPPSAKELFLAALELSPGDRLAFLGRECSGDDDLRHRVEALLAAYDDPDSRLESPTPASPPTAPFEAARHGSAQSTDLRGEGPGDFIGPYKLLQPIGEGGFGVVYMAEQLRPVRRKVALKIIKPGMDTREVAARFESERQALALMDHPNIARVFDAGATASGRPYFVMELVKGVPITEFCDKNHLTTEQRLGLFMTVCRAVQHAHQKGIIHRDIKPSNVMVTLHDGEPVPKVIDFGVSKAMNQQLTEKTLFTAYGQMIGTPVYMSPEQAEMSGLDIDTRSDIYSLGVLLYELLTGSTPFDGRRLREAGFVEMQRIIREEAPPRPSTRLSTLGEALTIISSHRNTDPKTLGRELRGDLDVIVMKSLEKERGRRYDSPGAFADDIARFLRHEAIIARPPSVGYLLRKFATRHRLLFIASSVVAAALLCGAAISSWLAITARQARQEAQRAQGRAERLLEDSNAQRTLAQRARVEAEAARDQALAASQAEREQRQAAEEARTQADRARRAEADLRANAVRDRERVEKLNLDLRVERDAQRRNLYAAQLDLAQKAWDANDIPRLRDLLDATRPRAGDSDLRGFEWLYWQGRLHGAEQSIRLELPSFEDANRAEERVVGDWRFAARGMLPARFSRDGRWLATASREANSVALQLWESATGRRLATWRIYSALKRDGAPAAEEASRDVSANSLFGGNLYFEWGAVDSRRMAIIVARRAVGSGRSARAQLRVFEVESGRETLTRDAQFVPFDPESAFALSPEGDYFATPLAEPVVQICRTETGEEVGRVAIPSRNGHTRQAEQLALGPQGELVALRPVVSLAERARGTPAFGVTLYDRRSGATVTSQPLDAQRFDFSADGARLALRDETPVRTGANGSIHVLDAATGQELWNFATPPATRPAGPSSPLHFSLDGRWLAAVVAAPSGIGLIKTWDLRRGEEGPVFQGESSTPVALTISEDNRRVCSLHRSGNLVVWNLSAAAEGSQRVLNRAEAEERTRAASRRANEVASPNGRWRAIGVDPASSAGVAGRTDAASGTDNQATTIAIRDNAGEVVERTVTIAPTAARPKFSPDSRWLLAVGMASRGDLAQAGELKVWEVATGREVVAARFPRIDPRDVNSRLLLGGAAGANFSHDGRWLAATLPRAADRPELTLHMWDLATGRLVTPDASRTLPSLPGAHYFAPDGSWLLVAPPVNPWQRAASRGRAATNTSVTGARAWNPVQGKVLVDEPRAQTMTFNAAGTRFVGWCSSERPQLPEHVESFIVVWNAADGRKISEWKLATPSVGRITVSPDGKRVAVLVDQDVLVGDADQGRELFRLQGHVADVRAVAFCADNSRIASLAGASSFGRASLAISPNDRLEAKIWDGYTGRELLQLPTVPGQTWELLQALDSSLRLETDLLRMSAGLEWRIESASSESAAEDFLRWVVRAESGGLPPTIAELETRLDADKLLPPAARELVRARGPDRLIRAALPRIISTLTARDLPDEEYRRALAWVVAAREAGGDVPYAPLWNSWGSLRLGDAKACREELGPVVESRAAAGEQVVAEEWTVLALARCRLGEVAAAREAFTAARRSAALREPLWRSGIFAELKRELTARETIDEADRGAGRAVMPRVETNGRDRDGRVVSVFPLPIQVSRVVDDVLWSNDVSFPLDGVVPLDHAPEYYSQALELQANPAAEQAERSASDSSTLVSLLNRRAVAWRARGESARALADLSAAIELAPSVTLFINRARLLLSEERQFEQALNDLDRALQSSPQSAEAHGYRCQALLRLQRLDAARDAGDEAVRRATNQPDGYVQRAAVWAALEDREKMLADLDEATRLAPMNSTVWLRRAVLLATAERESMRDGTLALAAVAKARDLTDDAPSSMIELAAAAARAELGQFDEAVRAASKARDIAPPSLRAECQRVLDLFRDRQRYRRAE